MYAVRTLGTPDVRSADDAVVQSILVQPKRTALLCYLAACLPGIQSRDRLVAMFWPELDHEHARNALSQAVHFLRRSLGADAILARNSDDLDRAFLSRADALPCRHHLRIIRGRPRDVV